MQNILLAQPPALACGHTLECHQHHTGNLCIGRQLTCSMSEDTHLVLMPTAASVSVTQVGAEPLATEVAVLVPLLKCLYSTETSVLRELLCGKTAMLLVRVLSALLPTHQARPTSLHWKPGACLLRNAWLLSFRQHKLFVLRMGFASGPLEQLGPVFLPWERQ
jgi:hypothetical protein